MMAVNSTTSIGVPSDGFYDPEMGFGAWRLGTPGKLSYNKLKPIDNNALMYLLRAGQWC